LNLSWLRACYEILVIYYCTLGHGQRARHGLA
jgi:hypothetical protein